MLIGLQLYTVRDDCAKDLPGVLAEVSRMGYSGVEFAGYYGRSASELRKMLDDNHLSCYGSHVPLDDLLGDKFDKTVAFNQTLGNKLITIPWVAEERRNTRQGILATATLFNELAEKLEQHKIMLAYHDHAGDFKTVDGDLEWNTLFANTSRDVKIQFDIGNALQGGQQAAPFLTKYPGRFVSAHVKDFSASNPKALLGEGDEDWKTVIPILKGKNGPRWFIIEQEAGSIPPMAYAEKCLRNFEHLLQQY